MMMQERPNALKLGSNCTEKGTQTGPQIHERGWRGADGRVDIMLLLTGCRRTPAASAVPPMIGRSER